MAYSTYLLSKGTETVKTPALTKCLNIKSGNTQQDALVSKAADNERNAYNIIARAAVNYNGAAVAGKSYLDGFLSYDFNDNWRCITTARINGMNILAYDRNVLSNDVKTRAEQHKKFLTQIVSTLAYLNDIGIIHNDIKTENVFVDTTNPKNPAIKLINFGNSIAIQPGANQQILSGAGVQSSLLFDAPEIYACDPSEKQSALRNMASKIGIGKSNSCKPVKYDPRKKDIWSLGVLYYLIFTGKYVLPIPTGQNFRDQYITELRNIYGSENKLNLNFQDYNRADKSTQLDWLFTHIEKYLKNTIQRPTPTQNLQLYPKRAVVLLAF
ncbi:kinase-like domain-containing protein [Syncephalis fuscata]|nr:kinase-like domain-containing protein [Syncephalis fuscata]